MASAAIAIVIAITGSGCGNQQAHNNGTAAGSQSADVGKNYTLKYDWPEKPKVGTYTLKVNITDGSGAPARDVEVVVSYDMPSMRGAHATTENMKQNARGDFLLPIRFVMPGDWEIVVSAVKDGVEVAAELILLDI